MHLLLIPHCVWCPAPSPPLPALHGTSAPFVAPHCSLWSPPISPLTRPPYVRLLRQPNKGSQNIFSCFCTALSCPTPHHGFLPPSPASSQPDQTSFLIIFRELKMHWLLLPYYFWCPPPPSLPLSTLHGLPPHASPFFIPGCSLLPPAPYPCPPSSMGHLPTPPPAPSSPAKSDQLLGSEGNQNRESMHLFFFLLRPHYSLVLPSPHLPSLPTLHKPPPPIPPPRPQPNQTSCLGIQKTKFLFADATLLSSSPLHLLPCPSSISPCLPPIPRLIANQIILVIRFAHESKTRNQCTTFYCSHTTLLFLLSPSSSPLGRPPWAASLRLPPFLPQPNQTSY